MPVVVVEAGGTSLRAGLFDPGTRTVSARHVEGSPNHLAGGRGAARNADLVHRIVDLVDPFVAGGCGADRDVVPTAVCVAYPGPVSADGTVLAAPTVTGVGTSPFPLQSLLRGRWPGLAVRVVNDLTAAGARYVAEGRRTFCVLTVGSGIGHKVFHDGVARTGPGGRGGEIGHLRVDTSPTALCCDCGGRGHLGGIASGRGVAAQAVRALAERRREHTGSLLARTPPEELDGRSVAAAFRAGDALATDVVQVAGRLLGTALAAIHLDTGVEEFVVVGGFALGAGEPYRRMLAAEAAASCWDLGLDWDAALVLGHEDGNDGLVGAGLEADRWT